MKTRTIIDEIMHEDLVSIFSAALYGSSWLACYYDRPSYYALPNASDTDCCEDKLAKLLLAGQTIELLDYYSEEVAYGTLPHEWDEEEECMVYTISLEDVKKGLQKAFDSENDYERKCANDLIVDDGLNFDNPEAECICQLIMFGEQIYG